MKDPQRLRDQVDLPDALQDALRGLGRSTPPPEVVARIQRSLAGLPGPAASPPSIRPAGGFTARWSAGAVKAALAAVGGVAVAVLAVVAMRPPAVQPAALVRIEQPGTAWVALAESEIVEPQLKAEASARAAAREPVGAARKKERSSMRPDLHARSTQAQNATTGTRAARAGETASAVDVARSEATAARAGRRQPVSAEAAPAKLLQAPEDEAGLLYRAKKASRNDRHAALSMLEQHAQFFPHGVLVEERELLAIEVLRSMGREADAKRRTAQFLSTFPSSIYRSSLVP